MKLCEIVDVSLVNTWWNTLPYTKKKSYGTRDNCGPAAYAFIDWAENTMGMGNLGIVSGYFRADDVIHDKTDFTKDMKKEFKSSGLDFNNPDDRKTWILNSKYAEKYHYVPHMWVINGNEIIDPSGDAQFIKKGLASDLRPGRYSDNKQKVINGKWHYNDNPANLSPWDGI